MKKREKKEVFDGIFRAFEAYGSEQLIKPDFALRP